MKRRRIKTLFWAAGALDVLFGAAFLVAPGVIYAWVGMAPPEHLYYVRFPAALVAVFGLMFCAVAADPPGNRNLIPFGILFKLAYCGVVFGSWLGSGIPGFWIPLAACDAVFAVLFFVAWRALEPEAETAVHSWP